MLRITRVVGPEVTPLLKLEGKLQGPWVAELARVCAEAARQSAGVALDLSAVSFLDEPGVRLLQQLLGRGVKLTACSGLIAELLQREQA
jgi:hypothetical protein